MINVHLIIQNIQNSIQEFIRIRDIYYSLEKKHNQLINDYDNLKIKLDESESEQLRFWGKSNQAIESRNASERDVSILREKLSNAIKDSKYWQSKCRIEESSKTDSCGWENQLKILNKRMQIEKKLNPQQSVDLSRMVDKMFAKHKSIIKELEKTNNIYEKQCGELDDIENRLRNLESDDLEAAANPRLRMERDHYKKMMGKYKDQLAEKESRIIEMEQTKELVLQEE